MTKLVWDNKTEGLYDSGVSKGVFFGSDGVGHAWAGLISVAEKPQANEPTAIYNSLGEKYDIHGNKAEKKHGLSCYTYPDVMESYLGFEILDDYGYRVDERNPKKFSMAYRVELGNGLYEIHVLLNQIASLGELTRQTQSANVGLSTVTMTLEGVPDPKFKTSHVILDSRLPITKSAEKLLFGSDYTDSNINDFLTAEPVWETVATNYAPIIEPDYDNKVWLGGENLANFSIDGVYKGASDYEFDAWASDVMKPPEVPLYLKPNTVYTTRVAFRKTHDAIPDKILNNQCMYMILYAGSGKPVVSITPIRSASWVSDYLEAPIGTVYNEVRTFTTPSDLDGYRIYGYAERWADPDGSNVVRQSVELIHVKIEEGDTATPWTPASADPNQQPRSSDPYPENYKPGIKKSDLWIKRNTQVYYDEMHNGMGVYSTFDSNEGVLPLDRPRVDIRMIPRSDLLDASVRFCGLAILDKALEEPTTIRSRSIRVGQTGPYTNQPANQRGKHVITASTDSLPFYSTGDELLRVLHGGGIDSGTITFKDMLLTTSNYTGGYFDVNTKPSSQGDRYRRVETPNGDYTVYEQLRLRSTTKVTLRDITQYEYWIDAADTMLLLQNEIFTFSGPQAVITDDTFTIDDSIVGFANDASE